MSRTFRILVFLLFATSDAFFGAEPLEVTASSPVAISDAAGDPVVAGFCPGFGDCFTPHGSPGCSDEACCNAVCSQDADCCLFEWDSICVTRAEAVCSSTCPAPGSCFSQHGNPGCNDANCCNKVCADEPLCCALDWDSTCVTTARQVCATGNCPAAGSCTQPHSTPGCENAECCRTVCAADADCCTGAWDDICVARAREVCGCAGEGNCFLAHPGPSCDSNTCCRNVCAEDSACCDVEWDCRCAALALSACGASACPGDGNCYAAHAGPGCEDEICCNAVCLADAECCGISGWDSLCVARAREVCISCPGEGDCFAPQTTGGCENEACCSSVCAADPWCCSVAWDSVCVDRAAILCAGPACPGAGDCLTTHGTPGCADESCCDRVCLSDPKCCAGPWDSLCVSRAGEVCDACPGEGRCDVAHDTPGCENETCCRAVCDAHADCCRGLWSLRCAQAARELCANPACPGEGSCLFIPRSTPGCHDTECCNAVCLQDAGCCGLDGWDSLCIQRANVICRIPPNDNRDDAIPIAVGEFHRGTSTFGTVDPEAASCPDSVPMPGVWYSVIGTGGVLVADTCDIESYYDTRLTVYTGACGRALDCVTGNDDACGEQSLVSWVSQLGERYLLFVQGAFFGLRLTVPEACPVGRVSFVEPPGGVVDGREPHPLDDPNQHQGFNTVRVIAPSGADPTCWQFCETPSDLPPNAIVKAIENAGVYMLTFARPIPPGGALKIRYADLPGNTAALYISHPGNIDGDGVTDAQDVLALVRCLRENDEKFCNWGFPYAEDVDHSGAFNLADLVRLVDLINGANAFEVWNGTPRPPDINCP